MKTNIAELAQRLDRFQETYHQGLSALNTINERLSKLERQPAAASKDAPRRSVRIERKEFGYQIRCFEEYWDGPREIECAACAGIGSAVVQVERWLTK